MSVHQIRSRTGLLTKSEIMKPTKSFLRFLLLFGIFVHVSPVFSQTPQWCDFWGQASFRGTAVGAADVIQAYNSSGQLCGETQGNSGWYNVRVHAIYEGSPYYPAGATEGEVITFKINGQTANIQSSGSNTWNAMGSKQVDIEVPYEVVVVADPGGPYNGQEGSSVNFNGSGSLDANTYEWDFGDGSTGSGVSPSHTYADDGSYTVTLTCRNGDKNDTETTTATISNVNPTAAAGSNKSANEGAGIPFSGSATDPGTSDVLSYSWNFGDGQSGSGPNVTHIYTDNGSYTVTLTVSDGDGGQDTDQVTATISNVAPTAEAGGPYAAIIGQAITLNGSATDPGAADRGSLSYAWDLDNDGQYDDAAVANPNKIFYSVGSFPVGLRVTDKDGGSSTDNATVQVYNSVQVTITTNPSGLQFQADGQTYTAPHTFLWAPGSQHNLFAFGPQYKTVEWRYRYTGWDHSSVRQHDYTVPSGNVTLKANYLSQYKLTVESDYGNPTGEDWYYHGANVTFGVTTPVDDGAGIRHSFTGWTGAGSGSYTGANVTRTITMNNPVTETAAWSTDYFLTTNVNPAGGGTVTPAPPGAWYAAGTQATVTATAAAGSQWDGWSGDLGGNSSPDNILMDAPRSVTAEFTTQNQVTVQTNVAGLTFLVDGEEYDEPQTFTWAEGSSHALSAPSPQAGAAGVQYLYENWSDGDGQQHDYVVPAGNATVTANYKTQYYLDIVSAQGIPQGIGWYDDGALATISIDTVFAGQTGERFRFSGWTGTGAAAYTGQNPSPNIVMTSPVTETAGWTQQYLVTLDVEPDGSGQIQPFNEPGGWASAGEVLSLTAVGNAAGGYGFFDWTGDQNSTQNPLSLTVNAPVSLTANFAQGTVQVTSDPAGLSLIVDGEEVVSPRVYDWAPGETHTLGVVTPQGDSSSAMYTFESWSDGGAAEHEVVISGTSSIFTAFFDAAYRIRVNSDFGTPKLNGQATDQAVFPVGSLVSVSIDSLIPVGLSIRQRFDGWQGSGNGALTTAIRNIQVVVNGPITQTAKWKPQFQVTVNKIPEYAPGATTEIDPPGPWYDMGQTIELTAVLSDTGYTFLGWSGAATGIANPVSVIVDGALVINANFETPNQPPVIQPIPMFDILEDNVIQRSFAWFLNYVSDQNDPLDNLEFGFGGDVHIQVQVDSANSQIRIVPNADWSGEESIVVWARDPFGETARDTVTVKVRSVPDPPKPFALINPAQNYDMDEWTQPMAFRWERSRNVDISDSVRYTFYLSPNQGLIGLGTFRITDHSDTSITIFPQVAGTYYWGVRAEDTQGHQTWCDEIFRMDITSSVATENQIPNTYSLGQNYPNPFNPVTVIPYDLPRESPVQIQVFDTHGRLVNTLVDQKHGAGSYEITWFASDDSGMAVASGVYVVWMRTPTYQKQMKVILMR